jgi:hypothetical protein
MKIQKSTNGKIIDSYEPDYEKSTVQETLNIYKIRHPAMFNKYNHEIFGNTKNYIRIDFEDLQRTTLEFII